MNELKLKPPGVRGFNTGRQYQADGQRISYAETEEGDVLFFDHSRGIYGRITREIEMVSPGAVLAAYDKGEYEYDLSGRADKLNAGSWPVPEPWKRYIRT